MLKIVIPAAGNGSRFASQGYTEPKPFIPLNDRPMIKWVMDNVRPNIKHRFVLIFQKAHEELVKKYRLDEEADIIYVDAVTQGAACTVLLSTSSVSYNDELMIVNSDQLVHFRQGVDDFLNSTHWDGTIALFSELTDCNKWSYAAFDESGRFITKTVEKKKISNWATAGLYHFRRAGDFFNAANEMISNNDRTNNEFYVCPVFNWAIKAGNLYTGYEVDSIYQLGTPEEMQVNWPRFKQERLIK